MTTLTRLYSRFFDSLPGLMLVAVAWDAAVVASLSPLSGPLQTLGVASLLGLDLDGATRVGRIIMLYHSLAMPLVAALVYLALDCAPLGPPADSGSGREAFAHARRRAIAAPITVGYMLVSLGGMTFGYGGRSWIAHGVYLVGLSLVFYAGLRLAVGLWPRRAARGDLSGQSRVGTLPLERLAFFLVALYTLISAAIGASAGAFFGNGFEAFLAEDIVRVEAKTLFQLAIIAHLHIMLTLIDCMILLLIIRIYRVRGRIHRLTVPLTIVGMTIVTLACWSVVFWEGAHIVINVGSAFLLPGALLVAGWGFAQLVRDGGARARTGIGARLRTLLRDPVRFGIFFELILVNAVVTAPGVYTAMNLDTFRLPEWLEVERSILVGHWHILSTLSAVMVLFLIVDRLGVRGWLRQVAGWGLLVGTTLAFVFVDISLFRQPGREKLWTVPFFETGIALSLLALAVLVAVQLVRTARHAGPPPSPCQDLALSNPKGEDRVKGGRE
ncbi:MAG TPA: hypothetical protein PKO09_07550 [Anaerolineae bacterium]|nr:hypothetical protein [Anaerolineae bacterium]